jgi:hypothetical protein
MDIYPEFTFYGNTLGEKEKVALTRSQFKLGLAYTFPVK